MNEKVEIYLNKFKQKINYIYTSLDMKYHQFFFVGVIIFALLLLFTLAPLNFPSGTLIEIKKGSSLNEIAYTLKQKSVIRSEILFKTFVVVLAGQGGALSGDYFFEEKQSVLKIARRVSLGIYGLTPLKVRLQEGATVKDMSITLSEKIPEFDKEEFLRIARNKEGFLFPDTYFFLPNVAPIQVVREMEKTLNKKIEKYNEKIKESNKTLEDIIIMASILEKEANWLEDKKIIAGILWKRMEMGMRLQVDAPFIYERNRNTFQLTTKELREDSPYNTYTNTGLTPTAIANPGLDSIIAAIEPIESDYLFYLSDISGNMYYAENYKKHLFYKRKYID